jgi:extracellular factor (EF) 3-hydroxypalmitic acid methyl ester biosynthesis protein
MSLSSLAVPLARSTGTPTSSPTPFIDRCHSKLADGDISAMLDDLRRDLTTEEWRAYVADVVAPHPIRPLLFEEPFTRRAYEKPRGYAGDAPMLDLVYADHRPPMQLTELGTDLYEWTITSAGCRSVRARRDILAALIDRIVAERTSPRILSVACGHLREAQRSEAVRGGAIAELVALDQDRESLALVAREQRANNVTPVHATIRRFLANGSAFGTFDLVYSAGLYDYLESSVAQALTAAMFRALRPGGTLLIANFAPNLFDIGYMEAIMDWMLLYRAETEVTRFAARIPPVEIAEQRTFRDEPGNVVYLTLRRA